MLTVDDLIAGYQHGSRVLDGVSFHVRRGEIVALMGRNGMGKTTVLRAITGHLPAAKGTIAMGQNAVDIEITVAAAAAVADKADVNILGTATAAANQTNASPNFTLSVTKK